ncbi:MAG: response regulator [Thermoguttaceae bacterium]
MFEPGFGTDRWFNNRNTRVLVAEDNAALALVVRFHLDSAGFHVVLARDGVEAWELLKHEHFDVVITDQQMPELSGAELCKRMRAEPRLAPVPVIMLTAKGLEMELERVRNELRLSEVLPKPFSLRQLVEIVEGCVAASRA